MHRTTLPLASTVTPRPYTHARGMDHGRRHEPAPGDETHGGTRLTAQKRYRGAQTAAPAAPAPALAIPPTPSPTLDSSASPWPPPWWPWFTAVPQPLTLRKHARTTHLSVANMSFQVQKKGLCARGAGSRGEASRAGLGQRQVAVYLDPRLHVEDEALSSQDVCGTNLRTRTTRLTTAKRGAGHASCRRMVRARGARKKSGRCRFFSAAVRGAARHTSRPTSPTTY